MKFASWCIIMMSFATYFLIPGLKERADIVVSQELLSLLHTDDKAALEYRDAQSNFKALDMTMVIVSNKDPKKVAAYLHLLEKDISQNPLPHTSKVISEIKDIISFYDLYAPLFIPADVYDHVLAELEKDEWLVGTKKKRTEINIHEEKIKAMKSLKRSFKSFYFKHKHTKLSRFKELEGGRFISKDGQTALIIIMHPTALSSLKEIEEFSSALNERIVANQSAEFTETKIMIAGDANTYYKEYEALWNGFGKSTIMSILLTFLVLYYFFRSARAILIVGHALLAGILLSSFILLTYFDEINSNSIFIMIVVLGNVVNSNIVFMHYYLCSQDEETSFLKAKLALKQSIWPTSFAVLSSCLVYFSFYIGDFRGYQDMAIVGIVGMSTTWITGILILFSLCLTPLARFSSAEIQNYFKDRFSPLNYLYTLIVRHHKIITVISSVMILIALTLVFKVDSLQEKDMTKLKDKNYLQSNLESLSLHLEKVGLGVEFVPQLVLVTNSRKHAVALQNLINEDKLLRQKLPSVRTFTIEDLLPKNQEKTALAIKALTKSYPLDDILESPYITKWQEKLTADAFNFKQDLRVDEAKIPSDLRALFVDQNGNHGNVIYLSFNLNRLERNIDDIKVVVNRLKELGGENLYMAGTIPLLASIESVSSSDRPLILGSSVLLCLLSIVFFNFRTRRFLPAYLFAYVGIAATFFLYLILTGTKINILNFIALPMTIALGIDYISNYAQGFSAQDVRIRSKTFMMVATMSFTTMVGYLSIYLTTSQLALKSFAEVSFVGELITLLGGIVFFFAFHSQVSKSKPETEL